MESEDEKAPSNGVKNDSPWLDQLQTIGKALIPAVLTAGGLIGFVAFAGSVIVWTRFYAAQVPPDQAVAAFPRGELVAIASALLLLFGFVGVLAVIGLYLIDGEAKATRGMSRGLLVLLAVEGIVVILLGATSSERTLLACELFLLPVFAAFWATFVNERDPKKEGSGQPTKRGASTGTGDRGLVDRMSSRVDEGVDLVDPRKRWYSNLVVIVFWVALIGLIAWQSFGVPLILVSIIGLGVGMVLPTVLLPSFWTDEKEEEEELEPGRQPFTKKGVALVIVLLPAAAIGPWLLLHHGWLPLSLLVAVWLVGALWRVAIISNRQFRWYGLAVFISVPLFGTLTGVVRNFADPQVQPMALIREADGPDEAIQGLYVTESDSRIYFATVATEGCSDRYVPHSGRLLWVPKSEVVAMTVGPLQSVDDAANTALEMSYALTPAVETPAGDHVSLTVAEKRTREEEKTLPPSGRRLESSGPAISPNFGAGLRLEPETASPGQVVTLRMSEPNRHSDLHGFGQTREHRTLRLGGVPVDVLKEEARSPWDAEYVEDSGGKALKLVKHTVFTEREGEHVQVEPDEVEEGEPLFVELKDDSVLDVDDNGLATERYLRIDSEADGSSKLVFDDPHTVNAVETTSSVTMRAGGDATLKPRLLRQAWHEDHIRFRVPENVSTGPVTVQCEQLAGQPLLRIAEPPAARISLRTEPGSQGVVFDSRRSSDRTGEIVSRRWTIEGLAAGHGKRVVENLPPRMQSYSVQLTVVDSEGQSATAQLHLLRLPSQLVSLGKHGELRHPEAVARAKVALRSAMASEPTAAIEFDSHLSGGGSVGLAPAMALEDSEEARDTLLSRRAASASIASPDPEPLTVKTLAFGDDCPAEQEGEGGYLDVMVLSEGVEVMSPPECPPIGVRTAHWPLGP